jgi:hypothetical protein
MTFALRIKAEAVDSPANAIVSDDNDWVSKSCGTVATTR